MNNITTFDNKGQILSALNLYDGADFEFYSQGNKYIFGYYQPKDYYIDNGCAVKFPSQPENTIWDWNTKQWVQSSASAIIEINKTRKQLLEQSDWTQLPNGPLTVEQQQAWADYRQQLRDIPSQSGYPFNVVWPTPPQG
jgi:hypothetical protein